ncbi:DEAD/DEAH box helicase [Spiroplasma endosymbiont of Amphibalanus improvisus]|uniref:DEAD/DEAH box helicase n=1 Tax=Spiroplasma endosymbiont of Amphibalanus improvisus TaxID=3066327 RepID=UPI00313E784F
MNDFLLHKITLSSIIFKLMNNADQIGVAYSYKREKNYYFLPNTIKNLSIVKQLAIKFGDDKQELSKIEKWIAKIKDFEQEAHLKTVEGSNLQVSNLRKYQQEDLKKIIGNNFIALFNEPRTGKTPTTLEWLKHKDCDKIIVICPKSLQNLVWVEEIKKWYPTLKIYQVIDNEGNVFPKNQRLKYINNFFSKNISSGILIISKDTFKTCYKDIVYAPDQKIAGVIDEAHWLRNNKTKQSATLQSKAVMHLRKHLSYAIILTGTPVVNHNSDLFGQLSFLYPKRFDNYWSFISYFWEIDFFKNPSKFFRDAKDEKITPLQEEFNKLVEPLFIRRLRKSVMTWLPIVEKKQFFLPLDKTQLQKEVSLKMQYKNSLHGSDKRLGLLIQMRLNAIIGQGKQSAKIKWLCDFSKHIEDNEQIIVYSSFSHKVIPFIEAALHDTKISFATLIGDTKLQERTKIVESFRNKKFKVLLCNIQVAKEGLTLENAAYSIFFDRSYNPADNSQAEARFLPIEQGNNDDKIVIDLISINSIEEKIHKLLDKKYLITQHLLEDELNLL